MRGKASRKVAPVQMKDLIVPEENEFSMARYCPNCGKDTPDKAEYCPSCGAYTTEHVDDKVKELKENIEAFNLTKEALIFSIYIIAFAAALLAWQVLDIFSWVYRLLGSLLIAVVAVIIIRFLLNRFLM